MDKDEFLDRLTSMTKEEIHQFIIENGKGPKMINLVTWLPDNVENKIDITTI